jgi:DNA-directed RNA polymerase specialized sigma24 family protein
VGLVEELELVMDRLAPLQRRMVELRLQGYELAEIGAATLRSERTVRRVITRFGRILRDRCKQFTSA